MVELILQLIVFAFVVAPIPATIANIYLWGQYRASGEPRSWLLRTLAVGATAVNASSVYFGFLAVRRILGAEPLDWTPAASAFLALLLELVPVYFALEFRRRDRRALRRTTDGLKAGREKAQDKADAAREVKRDEADAAREVVRDASDEVREEQHKEKLADE